jgi:glycosyltransferase involved in cell wall biosynthesis
MRVLFLVHGLPVGGTEVMVCHLVQRLRGRGVDVTVGCLDVVGELGETLRSSGVPLELYGRRPGFDMLLPFRIARAARAVGADIIHAHQYTCFFYAALAKPLSGARVVFTEHGRFYPDLPSPKRRIFNRVFGGQADAITAVSHRVKDSLVQVEGFPAESIEVIYNGIDVETHETVRAVAVRSARERLEIPAASRVVGTIGRLDSIKNQKLLLGACALLARDVPDLVVVLVGDGPERADLESTAGRLGMTGRTRFLGTRRDVREILPAFDVFALSSLSEGTPMSLIEAMAAGVPVVSTAVGGIPEIVEDREEGILVAPEPDWRPDEPALTQSDYPRRFKQALERVLLDSALAERLRGNARSRARRCFTIDGITEQYLNLYGRWSPAGHASPVGLSAH